MRIPSATKANTPECEAASHSAQTLPSVYEFVTFLPLLFVVVLFLGYFVVLLVYGQALFRFPFDYDQGEGFELYDAFRLSHGQNIYLDNTVYPFYSSNYPPLYRLMLVPLLWIFGPQIWV